MNISKFTQKSVQAVQDLEKVAYEYGNQEIEQEHLLYTLLTQEDSLILKLIEKMEINKEYFLNTVKNALDAKVKVSGGELRFGQYLNKALVNAEDEAKAMGDEYVSVEHEEETGGYEKDMESMSKKELKEVIERLSKKMNQAAAELNFELAAQLRDELKEFKIAYQEYDD